MQSLRFYAAYITVAAYYYFKGLVWLHCAGAGKAFGC